MSTSAASRLHKQQVSERVTAPSLAYCGHAPVSHARPEHLAHMQLWAFMTDIELASGAQYPHAEIRQAVEDLLGMMDAHVAAEECLLDSEAEFLTPSQRAASECLARNLAVAVASYLTEWDSPAEPVLECARTWLADHLGDT